jgi:hypothetical protein
VAYEKKHGVAMAVGEGEEGENGSGPANSKRPVVARAPAGSPGLQALENLPWYWRHKLKTCRVEGGAFPTITGASTNRNLIAMQLQSIAAEWNTPHMQQALDKIKDKAVAGAAGEGAPQLQAIAAAPGQMQMQTQAHMQQQQPGMAGGVAMPVNMMGASPSHTAAVKLEGPDGTPAKTSKARAPRAPKAETGSARKPRKRVKQESDEDDDEDQEDDGESGGDDGYSSASHSAKGKGRRKRQPEEDLSGIYPVMAVPVRFGSRV